MTPPDLQQQAGAVGPVESFITDHQVEIRSLDLATERDRVTDVNDFGGGKVASQHQLEQRCVRRIMTDKQNAWIQLHHLPEKLPEDFFARPII